MPDAPGAHQQGVPGMRFTSYLRNPAWRRLWQAGQLPRFYSRSGQQRVDALYHRMALEEENVPGGSIVVETVSGD